MLADSDTIPLLVVDGSHYEIGYKIGETFRERIHLRIKLDLTLQTLFEFVKTDFCQQLYAEYVAAIRSVYPWYYDEMKGTSDGSQLSLDQILCLNFQNETKMGLRRSKEKENGSIGCSTVLLNRDNEYSILHNEDASSSLFNVAYLIVATINEQTYADQNFTCPKEKFISYCYAGTIPGNAFSANVHGLVFTLNGLYPNYLTRSKLPRQIMNRVLLSISTVDELDHLLSSQPTAFGFSVNVGFYHQKRQRCLLNYEVGPKKDKDLGTL
ncbi:unnamed protein product, partial [Didymodactylos carnosus]